MDGILGWVHRISQRLKEKIGAVSLHSIALHCMVTGTSTGSMHPTNSYVEAGAAGIWEGCNGSRQIVPRGPSIWANCSGPNCPRSNLPRTGCNGRSAPSYFSQSILFLNSLELFKFMFLNCSSSTATKALHWDIWTILHLTLFRTEKG